MRKKRALATKEAKMQLKNRAITCTKWEIYREDEKCKKTWLHSAEKKIILELVEWAFVEKAGWEVDKKKLQHCIEVLKFRIFLPIRAKTLPTKRLATSGGMFFCSRLREMALNAEFDFCLTRKVLQDFLPNYFLTSEWLSKARRNFPFHQDSARKRETLHVWKNLEAWRDKIAKSLCEAIMQSLFYFSIFSTIIYSFILLQSSL